MSRANSKFVIPVFLAAIFPLAGAGRSSATAPIPEFLNFDELVALSETDEPADSLQRKLDNLLNTPFLGGNPATQPHRPSDEGLGPVLRVACWNIERGLNFDLIRLAFSDSEAFQRATLESGAIDPEKLPAIEKQLRTLRDADVIVLNEVDLGMKRTDYRDVAKDLARALNMNYVFGVEFVEVDRLDDLGIDPVRLEDPELTKQMQEELKPDPVRYRGLHGNAILSRIQSSTPGFTGFPFATTGIEQRKPRSHSLKKASESAQTKSF